MGELVLQDRSPESKPLSYTFNKPTQKRELFFTLQFLFSKSCNLFSKLTAMETFRVCLVHVIMIYYKTVHINIISRLCLERNCIGIKV